MLRPVGALRALRALRTGSTESDRATTQETHALPSRSPLVGCVARPRHPQIAGLQRCATTQWVHRSAQLPAAPGCAAAVCSRRACSTTRSAWSCRPARRLRSAQATPWLSHGSPQGPCRCDVVAASGKSGGRGQLERGGRSVSPAQRPSVRVGPAQQRASTWHVQYIIVCHGERSRGNSHVAWPCPFDSRAAPLHPTSLCACVRGSSLRVCMCGVISCLSLSCQSVYLSAGGTQKSSQAEGQQCMAPSISPLSPGPSSPHDGRDACSWRWGGFVGSARRGDCFGVRSVGCRRGGSRPVTVAADNYNRLLLPVAAPPLLTIQHPPRRASEGLRGPQRASQGV